MNIGELFVNLGIKGSEHTVDALSNVRTSLGQVSSMSIEAKAGLIGAMYAFEKLMAASGQMGTSLTNFTALTGISTRSLQQWQFAARQAGVSGEEMTGSLKNVQSAMTNLLLGNGRPEGFGLVASKVGLDPTKLRDTQYVLQQLQKFAQSVPADLANTVLKSFGLSEGVVSAMRRNSFRPEVFSRAPTYGEGEIRALDRANIAWSNLAVKIEMAFGRFNARHGGEIVKDVSHITDSVLKLVEALTHLADKLKVFQLLSSTLEGLAKFLDVFASPSFKSPSKIDFQNSPAKHLFDSIGEFLNKNIMPPTNNPNIGNKQNNNVTINNHFQHDGKNAGEVGDHVGKSVNKALRQMPAVSGGI